MPQIFFFAAGNSEARQHLVESIENQIDEQMVFGSFAVALREELERIREEGKGFYAWGAIPGMRNIPNWEVMQRGDYVLCVYENTYHYVARVLAKYENERFARRVWGEDENGKTLKYMYFLTEPIEVHRHVSELADYLNAEYRGYTRISDKKLDEIADAYGTTDAFIRDVLDYQSEGIPTQLMLAPDRSEEVAASSLEVDDIVHGDVEDVIPDSEGRKRLVQHVSYERSPKNRALAIKIHGTRCQACGFDFDEFYGRDQADSYIEVHHVRPLSEHEGKVDPTRDLVCLCVNCHKMAHRKRTSVTSVDELRVMIEEANG
jgi:predicted restriction endonuclease